jgi:predicted MFS family arabinose efflux permease
MKTSFKILLFADAVTLFAGALLGPIYAIFVEKIGGDILDASGAFAVFSLVSGAAIFLISRFEDKVKEQELLIVAGYLIIALGYFGYLMVQNPFHLFIVQAVIGLGMALELPAIDATYARHMDHQRAAYNWGAWEGMNRFTMGGGALLGGLVVTAFGFHTLFILMGTCCLGSAIVIFFLPRKLL